MILCTRCQRDNDDDALYCKYCGKRIGVPTPGPEEIYGKMTRSALGLMEDLDNLPPDVRARRTVLTRLWIVAIAVFTLVCAGTCTVYLGQFAIGG